MYVSPTIRSWLDGYSELSGIPFRIGSELDDKLCKTLSTAVATVADSASTVVAQDLRFIVARFDRQEDALIVAGPFCIDGERSPSVPVLLQEREPGIHRAVERAAGAIRSTAAEQRSEVELARHADLMGRAIIAISGELSLESVLDRIVELAKTISDAKYAALGVPGPGGELRKFITTGMSPEQEARIGDLPRGRGVLGAIIRHKKSMRIRNIADHPEAVGFPENHPPMRSFLGVPIVARGEVLGNLYLTEKLSAVEFTEEDQRLVELLARHAAVAIENATLYAQLESQEQRLRFIIDQLPEAVILAETEPERITIANRQASLLLGWDLNVPTPLAEFFGRNERRDIHGNILEEDEIPLARSLRNGETIIRSELNIARPDGEQLTLLANAAPLRQRDGTITAAALVFQDITRIKDAEQLKDDFLSLVSHELRTPLTTIHGGSHLLLNQGELLDQGTKTEILNDILSESRRLASLVENMVQLANIRAGRFSIEAEPVHVGILVRRAINGLGESAKGREIRFDSGSGVLALGDNDSLEQVLRNLLQNAIKYVPDETPIVIESLAKGNQAVIAVRDFGPGVDSDDLPNLFDRFQRGRGKDTVPGMGLGLYLSRMIVEANGGRLWVELPEDGGSRFVFTLPLADEQ